MRLGGVLSDPVSESADEVRQAVATIAVATNGIVASDRATLLRAAGRQDADRDAHTGHAAERQQLQLALHVHDVTLCLAAAGYRIIPSLHLERRRDVARRSADRPISLRVAGERERERREISGGTSTDPDVARATSKRTARRA